MNPYKNGKSKTVERHLIKKTESIVCTLQEWHVSDLHEFGPFQFSIHRLAFLTNQFFHSQTIKSERRIFNFMKQGRVRYNANSSQIGRKLHFSKICIEMVADGWSEKILSRMNSSYICPDSSWPTEPASLRCSQWNHSIYTPNRTLPETYIIKLLSYFGA